MKPQEFHLDVFEGPLDLLLYLISKHRLNIGDIEIALLVDQYMEHITEIGDDMEYAAEFIEMAARLVYLKTVYLLPHKEEAQALKKELEGRLIEYSLAKTAAANLRVKWLDIPFCVKPPMEVEIDMTYDRQHDISELLAAYKGLSKQKKKEMLTSSAFSVFVTKRFVSVTTRMVYVLKELYRFGKCDISAMFAEIHDRSERVATFLAILELTRNGRILLSDDNSNITFNKEHSAEDEEFESSSQFDTTDEDEKDEPLTE